MARAGRTGGVDAAREIVSVIGALSTEGDEVNPDAIASRMGKTPEEASKFMDMLLYLGTVSGSSFAPSLTMTTPPILWTPPQEGHCA